MTNEANPQNLDLKHCPGFGSGSKRDPAIAMAADRERIDFELRTLLSANDKATNSRRLAAAMRYAVLSGGKRARPILALRVARLLGAEPSGTARLAAAVELVHCASLVVDDLPCMDDDAQRRDLPSVHARFGEATAILASFALLTLAQRSIIDQSCQPSMQEIRFHRSLLGALSPNGLIDGQMDDLRLRRSQPGSLDSPGFNDSLWRRISERKTAPLFVAAVQAGCAFTDVPEDLRRDLVAFGCELGIAYQMKDDLTDRDSLKHEAVEKQLSVVRRQIERLGTSTDELYEFLDSVVEGYPNGAPNQIGGEYGSRTERRIERTS